MTILLAIETSTEMASVAILGKNGLIWRELSGVQTHSQGILPAIQELLSEAGLSLNECDAIAFGCGPGAFTGVRTACGIVQGLAFGADLPILPVISLLAMAEAARQDAVEAPTDAHSVADFVCILDARMSEVYWAHYRYADQRWEQVLEPALSSFALALEYANANGYLAVLGNGLTPPAESSEIKVACEVAYKMPHARQVAQLGLLDYAQGKQVAADLAQPLYLRNKIALTTLERMQLKAAG
jgi:tRNA threonylcarbamoyladenosine biosynthesis protein TsaB